MWVICRVHEISYPAVGDKDLCEGPTMTSRLATHGLNGVHRCAWRTGGSRKDGREPSGMKGRHDGGGWEPCEGILQGFIVGWGASVSKSDGKH